MLAMPKIGSHITMRRANPSCNMSSIKYDAPFAAIGVYQVIGGHPSYIKRAQAPGMSILAHSSYLQHQSAILTAVLLLVELGYAIFQKSMA